MHAHDGNKAAGPYLTGFFRGVKNFIAVWLHIPDDDGATCKESLLRVTGFSPRPNVSLAWTAKSATGCFPEAPLIRDTWLPLLTDSTFT